MIATRNSVCRYCNRYGRACGRRHTPETVADWGRDWMGNPPPVVTFPIDDGSTAEVIQPAPDAVAAARAVHRGYGHIAVCDAEQCGCHNRGVVFIDGYPVPEPTGTHAGAVFYRVSTAAGKRTIRIGRTTVTDVTGVAR